MVTGDTKNDVDKRFFYSVHITSLDSCLEGVESSCPAAPGGGGGARSGGEDLSYTYLDPHKKLKVKPVVLQKSQDFVCWRVTVVGFFLGYRFLNP